MKAKSTRLATCILSAISLFATSAKAQLSSNPDKFLGNITTGYQVDVQNVEPFYKLWNQITPENESKWDQIEGSRRGSFNWGCDNAYKYARNHKFPFKFHTLIWGAQYPTWMNSLNEKEQYKAIEEWMDAIQKKYPDLDMIDVVNEALEGHQPAPYRAALGGEGKTGYDWIIKAFEMAYERWPNAILIYNDYNTFQHNTDGFIKLVQTLRDAGAPIDAYGCQSHDLTNLSLSDFKNAMTKIQNALKMPMYSSEYDIGTSDDKLQLQRYQEQIPYMWEADYCAGITLWGYIYGSTWTTDGNSGIIKNGKDRPAMTWLREYMKSEAAQNAKSPFPGMKKEASVYVKPKSIIATIGDTVPINIRARLNTKEIDHIDLYVNNKYFCTFNEAPYDTAYHAVNLGKYNLKAIVVATDSSKYERLSSFTAYNPRGTFKGEISLPGTLQAEDFDTGADGISYHDSDTKNEGDANYRTNGGGVDIVKGNGGCAIGYTSAGEWLEYTVDVKESGIYSYDVYASSGATNSSLSLALSNEGILTPLTGNIAVPCVVENNWDYYKAINGRLSIPLEAGKQVIRISITGSSCNIDKIVFKKVEVDENIKVAININPSPGTINTYSTISVTAEAPESEIQNVKIYVNGVLNKTLTEAPYETNYKPAAKGSYYVTAIATDTAGRQSNIVSYKFDVNNKRTPYNTLAFAVPGIIEAEKFDKGGEGFTFHDSDSKNEGDANFRNDGEGVDLVKGNNGTAIGYTASGEWLEYTIDVKEPGKYTCLATVSSGTTGSGFTIGLVENGKVTNIGTISVPQTANNNWDTYKAVSCRLNKNLEVGQQIIRLTITGANCNIDKLEFKCTLNTAIDETEACEKIKAEETYNLTGMKVDSSYKGVVIQNGKKVFNK